MVKPEISMKIVVKERKKVVLGHRYMDWPLVNVYIAIEHGHLGR